MPLSESGSRLAVSVWAAVWLPGLAVASWRMERLLRAGRLPRALLEVAALLSLSLVAFGLYALSDAQRYAQAHGAQVSWADWLSVTQVAIPYLASSVYLIAVLRPGTAAPTASRWWVAVLVGLVAALFTAPGLFMALLMVLTGN